MKRMGMVTRIKPEKLDKYVRLHADPWPRVLQMIKECHIRNYSIYRSKLPDGHDYLFSYFEYTGENFEGDMAKIAAHEETQRWWEECKPCLEPVEDLPPGEVWSPMESIFFQD